MTVKKAAAAAAAAAATAAVAAMSRMVAMPSLSLLSGAALPAEEEMTMPATKGQGFLQAPFQECQVST